MNEEIVTSLANAGIAVVLLGRCIYSYPRRSRFDLVGIDNRRAGFVICANDHTAAHLIMSLEQIGKRVPEDIRIVGIDDVKYASLLRVPLTTLRQPCRQIGAVAMSAMLERLEDPAIPARDILLDFELVIRRSSGA